MAYTGRFVPKNSKKYRGDPTRIVYRSLWERRVMVYLDENPSILEWASEEFYIHYVSPIDNRVHRYFPDFYVKSIDRTGKVNEMVWEIKPKKESLQPQKKSRMTKKYIKEVITWGVNEAKWKAAEEYCLDRNWKFKVLTEDDIFGK